MGSLCRFIKSWCTHKERHRCRTVTMTATLLLTSGLVSYEAVLHSCGTSPVGQWVPTCDSAHSRWLYSAASLEHQAVSSMVCYPTQSHYPDTEPTSPCPILIMPSTRLGSDKYQLYSHCFDSTRVRKLRSGFEPATFLNARSPRGGGGHSTRSATPTGSRNHAVLCVII